MKRTSTTTALLASCFFALAPSFGCTGGSLGPASDAGSDAPVDPVPDAGVLSPTCPWSTKIAPPTKFPGLLSSVSGAQRVSRLVGLPNGQAWALAYATDGAGYLSYALAHFTKSVWTKDTPDELVSTSAATVAYSANATDFTALPSGEVWVLVQRKGIDSNGPKWLQNDVELVHRDEAGAWTVLPFPEYKRFDGFDVPLSILAHSVYDIYVCGAGSGGPRVLHYDAGLTWATMPLAPEVNAPGNSTDRCSIAGGTPTRTWVTFNAGVVVGAQQTWSYLPIPRSAPNLPAAIEAATRWNDRLIVRDVFSPISRANAELADGAFKLFRIPEMTFAKFVRTGDGHVYAVGNDVGTRGEPARIFGQASDGTWGDCGALPGSADAVGGGGTGQFWVGGTLPDQTAYLAQAFE